MREELINKAIETMLDNVPLHRNDLEAILKKYLENSTKNELEYIIYGE